MPTLTAAACVLGEEKYCLACSVECFCDGGDNEWVTLSGLLHVR